MQTREKRRPNERSRATLKEVASKVGVSICTASVVLNNSNSGSRVSDATRTAVIEAARELGYRANQIARSLHAGHTHVIGVVPAATETNILLGPHLQHVLNGIVNETEVHGYDLSIITRCDQSRPSDLLDALLGGRMDGVIVVAPRSNSRLIPLLRDEHLPMVVIDGDPEMCDNIYVIDNDTSVRRAIQHLVDLGHRNIGHIAGPQDLFAARIRKDAFFREMSRLGVPLKLEWLQVGVFNIPSGEDAMNRILRHDELPTAVFCANDEMAFGAIRAILAKGLRVPEDITVVGFDDVPFAAMTTPTLTTIRQPVDEIARAATSALIGYIEEGVPIGSRTFPGSLVERMSSAPPRR
ncbi:MAG: LacI family DNA-binding transcriptional regulator [Fimbriimonas sp.]|nr:LacI family DNA-binding transcriptional regulator [Fimbriimonas sp.]